MVFYLNAIQLDEDLGPACLAAYYEDLVQVDEHLFSMLDILETVKKECSDEINCINAMSTMIEHLRLKQMLCYSILYHANVVGNIAILAIAWPCIQPEQIPQPTTSLFYTDSITSVNELLSDQMRCSIAKLPMMLGEMPKAPTSVTINTTSSLDWSLLCKSCPCTPCPAR